jgi:hypothetical protein
MSDESDAAKWRALKSALKDRVAMYEKARSNWHAASTTGQYARGLADVNAYANDIATRVAVALAGEDES